MFDFLKRKKNQEELIKEIDLFAMVDGELIPIDQVKDPVFSQKMMGDGFAFIPTKGSVFSPCEGQVLNVFPTKHALALKQAEVEILLHLGIDTVSLDGQPFDVKVNEDDSVTKDSHLVEVDLEAIKEAEKDDVMIVIFTNGNETIQEMLIEEYGQVKQGQVIGKLILK